MKKITFTIILIFQFLFFAELFSQTPNNKFTIAWFDYFRIGTSASDLTQHYKNMQTHNMNCAISMDILLYANTVQWRDPAYYEWASSNPSKSFLDSAHKYDIRVIMSTPENSVIRVRPTSGNEGWYMHSCTNPIIRQQGLAYWNHPALWGIFVMDEPYNGGDLAYISPHTNDIKAFNHNLLDYVNLPFAYDGLSFNAYEQLIQDYIDDTHPSILSFDYYPIFDRPDATWRNDLFCNMDIMARKSVENEIPFMYVFTSMGTNSLGTSYFIYPESVTGYSVYAALCYGAKGIAYWNSNLSSYYKMQNFSPKHKEFIKNINKRIIENEDVLLSLRFKSAYHKSTASTLRPGMDSVFTHSKWQFFASDPLANEIFNVNNPLIALSGSSIDSLVVTFLTDKIGNRYFWLFNKSLCSTVDIQLNLKEGGSVVDVLNGISCLPQNAEIYLDTAEGKLFKFIPNQHAPATRTIIEGQHKKSKKPKSRKMLI